MKNEAYVCDRCGNPFLPYINPLTDEYIEVRNHTHSNGREVTKVSCYDLCPECYGELDKWLKFCVE
jgi:hypothetical protein